MKAEKSFSGKDKAKMIKFVEALSFNPDLSYHILVKDTRSISQNSLYNARVRELANNFGVSFKDMKRVLKLYAGLFDRFEKDGEIYIEFLSTRDLNHEEMDSFLNQIEQWGVDHGYTFRSYTFKIGR